MFNENLFKLTWERNLETNVRCFNPLLWASLYTIHGWGLLFNVALTLRLCHPSSLLSILMLFVDIECSGPVAKQCSPTPVGLSKFRCSLNRTPKNPQRTCGFGCYHTIYGRLFHIGSPRESCPLGGTTLERSVLAGLWYRCYAPCRPVQVVWGDLLRRDLPA